MPEVQPKYNSLFRWVSAVSLILVTAWAIHSWRQQPLSLSYFVVCAVTGLVCGLLMIKAERDSMLWNWLVISIIVGGRSILTLFFDYDEKSVDQQYTSVVMAFVLAVTTTYAFARQSHGAAKNDSAESPG